MTETEELVLQAAFDLCQEEAAQEHLPPNPVRLKRCYNALMDACADHAAENDGELRAVTWRPMKTAPKMFGSRVFVWIVPPDERGLKHCTIATWIESAPGVGVWSHQSYGEPVAWMPIFEGPSAKVGSTGNA